jgi:cobalt-zinc-cadmium efflux system outer membrane protein
MPGALRNLVGPLALALALAGGGVRAQPPAALGPPAEPPAPPVLSLRQLLEVAAANNPDLGIAYARAQAARGRLIQAGLYPNPVVTWEAGDVNQRVGSAGTQGPAIAQQIVTAGKLRLAQNAAAQGVAAADWQAVTRWFDVATRVRVAYYEAAAAQEAVLANEEILRLASQELATAEKLQKAGLGTQPDVLRARVELNNTRMQLAVARERLTAAWRLLAAAVGAPALPPAPLAGRLEAAPPAYEWEPALGVTLARSSEVQERYAAVLQAEQLLLRARAQAVPDLLLAARLYYDDGDRNVQFGVEAGAAVPVFDRNQGNVRAAHADLIRAKYEVRQAELRLTERLALAFQQYRTARDQVATYEREVLRDAAESLRLVRLGYERGDAKYDYTTLLQAQQTLAQARLGYVQALGALWRAAAEIAGVTQSDFPDEPPAGPAVLLPPREE